MNAMRSVAADDVSVEATFQFIEVVGHSDIRSTFAAGSTIGARPTRLPGDMDDITSGRAVVGNRSSRGSPSQPGSHFCRSNRSIHVSVRFRPPPTVDVPDAPRQA